MMYVMNTKKDYDFMVEDQAHRLADTVDDSILLEYKLTELGRAVFGGRCFVEKESGQKIFNHFAKKHGLITFRIFE